MTAHRSLHTKECKDIKFIHITKAQREKKGTKQVNAKIFPNDGQPFHISKRWHHNTSFAFLAANVPVFTELQNWSQNRPDLNLVDYSIWEALQQLVYPREIRDLDHLKEMLRIWCEQIEQGMTEKANNQ